MRICLRRREFIAVLGGAAAWPLAARAQRPLMPVIGFLHSESWEARRNEVAAFMKGLAETGYIEGRNAAIEYRWAQSQYDQLPALAADLVRRRVAVIFAGSSAAARAAKAATTTIPIVFEFGLDPVALGLVSSLNRPGGNVTGVTSLSSQLTPKRLELLREIVPGATSFALLVNPTDAAATESTLRDAQAAARTLGLQLHVLRASTEPDLDMAFATFVQLRAGALVVGNDSFFLSRSEKLAALSMRHSVPAIHQTREFVVAGGLMSYTGDVLEAYRLDGVYVGRILKGEKPVDLPVQQGTKVELIINFKTAKTLGITVPLTLRGRADEVIE
jgi:putative ABC transport system substrate-binding protein